MEIKEIEDHKIIKLIKFSAKKSMFTVGQAATASGKPFDEFKRARYEIFQVTPNTEEIRSINQNSYWELKTSAFFSYLSFLEYRDSVIT